MKFAFASDHVLGGRAKATIHFVAEGLAQRGHDVRFLSTAVSVLARYRQNHSALDAVRHGRSYCHNGISCQAPQVLFHPQNLRIPFFNKLASPLYAAFPRLYVNNLDDFKEVDVVVIESGYSSMLYELIRQKLPNAKIVYWVSDDPISLNMHPRILSADRSAARDADHVVIASEQLINRYPRGRYLPKGIDANAFDACTDNPYHDKENKNVVSVGKMLFDNTAVIRAAELLPNFKFHVLGVDAPRVHPANVRFYGTVPFEKSIGFIKYADIGLAPYYETTGIQYLATSSLKLKQYAYCRLPVVVPGFAAPAGTGFYTYAASSGDSMAAAIRSASEERQRTSLDKKFCRPWPEIVDMVTDMLAGHFSS